MSDNVIRDASIGNASIRNSSRRSFLRTAPVAAAAGLTLAEALSFAAQAQPASPAYQLFTGQSLGAAAKALQDKPGNDNLVSAPDFTVVLTVETMKSAKDFEWHEARDHVFLVLDGTTVYELGGTPKDGRNTKPGEWLAPASEGAATVTLKKGDMLVIPRGTPHKRSTAESVTLILISPLGTVKA